MRKTIKVICLVALLWVGFHLTTTAYDLKYGGQSYKDNVDYLIKYGLRESFSEEFCSIFYQP